MTIKDYENDIRNTISNIVEKIIDDNTELPISVKSRGGAEISDWIEEKFVEYTKGNSVLLHSEQAPKEATKNPWDAKTYYLFNKHEEEIWIDFKAFKITNIDSNPDIGTPNKVIKHIQAGNFYLLYIHIFYEEHNDGLRFKKQDNKYVKSYFLKDVSSTVRRTTTNQLQVNISAPSEYRTREKFINFIMNKIKEGNIRQVELAKKRLDSLDEITTSLLEANTKSLKFIEEILQ